MRTDVQMFPLEDALIRAYTNVSGDVHELLSGCANASCILGYTDSSSTRILLICEHLHFQERDYLEFIDAELYVGL